MHICIHTCTCRKSLYVSTYYALPYTYIHRCTCTHTEVPAACVEVIPPMQNHLGFISFWFQSCGFVFKQASLPPGSGGRGGGASVSSKLCAQLLSEWAQTYFIAKGGNEHKGKCLLSLHLQSLSPLSSAWFDLPAIHPNDNQAQPSD